jgi:2-aminobenzoate-CoA ligase
MSLHSAHVDTFAADRLPPPHAQPTFLFQRPELTYPERLNACVELVDRHVLAGRGDSIAMLDGDGVQWTYRELLNAVNRIARVLTDRHKLVPGNRVLVRASNSPYAAAVILAIMRAGGIVVATMPLLRAKELVTICEKAEISLAICDQRLIDEMEKCQAISARPATLLGFGPGTKFSADVASAPERFEAVDTSRDDICLFGFTSGTTGVPKCTMHAHRDILAVCDAYGRNVLRAASDDIFAGSPPFAFTFGLGGLVLFPLRIGATALLLEKAGPADLVAAIARHRVSVVFTAPTAYRAMLAEAANADLSSLRICVSAGEALPLATFQAWKAATGLELLDGIGATEMLHIFIAAPKGKLKPGATGLPVPGYEAKVIGPDGEDLPPHTPGRLAVRGPTGCRYLDDPRQASYVQNGWNITGDTYMVDGEGYFWYQARSDDMIVSSGYNIAGPEVESALLTHPAVAECGVVGATDTERGTIVRAYIVLAEGYSPGQDLVEALQTYVKNEIAPYKYPRSIKFVDKLPRTQTGKLQRFELREMARQG